MIEHNHAHWKINFLRLGGGAVLQKYKQTNNKLMQMARQQKLKANPT